jgi:myo-inositol-hexaphosphate 3-phosphohydrolase
VGCSDQDTPARSRATSSSRTRSADGGTSAPAITKEPPTPPDGKRSKVDLRAGFQLGATAALVIAGKREDNTIAIYRVDPATESSPRLFTRGQQLLGQQIAQSVRHSMAQTRSSKGVAHSSN